MDYKKTNKKWEKELKHIGLLRHSQKFNYFYKDL